MFRSKLQQKSLAAFVLALLVFTWAPLAAAAETRGGVFAGLMYDLAVFLGLADEAGPDSLRGGVDAPVGEAGPNFSPGGSTWPANEAEPTHPNGGEIPNDEAGPELMPWG